MWRKEQGRFLDRLKSKQRLRDGQETVRGGQVGSTCEKWNRSHDTALSTQSTEADVTRGMQVRTPGGECDTS